MHRQNKVKYIISLLVILNCLSAKAAVTNLVEPVKFFTNHDLQFNKVSNQLLTYNQVGIVGISGMGKTQLARMYAYKHKEQYDIIWFFDCKVDLAEQFAGLAKIINILKNLAKKTNKELLEITNKMLPILQHNYKHIRLAARDEVWQLKQTLDEQFNK